MTLYAEQRLPAWHQQPGESWTDWSRRDWADKNARLAAKANAPRTRPFTGEASIAVGVGTYDCNGNPKGSGWHEA